MLKDNVMRQVCHTLAMCMSYLKDTSVYKKLNERDCSKFYFWGDGLSRKNIWPGPEKWLKYLACKG